MQLHHETLIRERAYAIWEQEGCPAGREFDHWVRAAREVTTAPVLDMAPKATAKPARKVAPKGKARKN